MKKVEKLLQSINELARPHYFDLIKDVKGSIETKNDAMRNLLDYIKKNKPNRFYLDALNWLKRLSDKEYLKLYKLYLQGK